MTPSAAEIAAALEQLGAAPERLAALSQGAGEARLRRRPSAEEWSPNDIVAHLRACADVWGKSIEKMLAQDHPTMRYASPRGYMRKTDYAEQAFGSSLAAYTQQREALLSALRALAPAGWARGATFTGTTRGREATVLSYARRIADHEAEHLAQLEALLR